MKKMAFLVLSAIGFSALAGCTAPVDGDDAEDAGEQVGEVGQAVDGDPDPDYDYDYSQDVPCTLIVPSFGQLNVKMTNNTGVNISGGAYFYTVHHYGTTAKYSRSGAITTLLNGASKTVSASSDPNALSASYCTATLFWD